MKQILPILFAIILFAGCKDQNEDVVKEPNKQGAVETIVSIKHGNGFDILTTTHKVWVKNKLDKTLVKIDTLAALGTTVEEAEDQNGKVQKVKVPKDYEFYITVR